MWDKLGLLSRKKLEFASSALPCVCGRAGIAEITKAPLLGTLRKLAVRYGTAQQLLCVKQQVGIHVTATFLESYAGCCMDIADACHTPSLNIVTAGELWRFRKDAGMRGESRRAGSVRTGTSGAMHIGLNLASN